MFPLHDRILGAVPEYDRYPTLDDLEEAESRFAALPGVASRRIGVSRAGRPIRCLEVGDGPLHAVLVGAPHPEELVGTLTLSYLLPLLADTDLAAQLGFRVSAILTADPDGVELNASWVAEPHDLEGFLLRAYRPARSEQFEWTFPIEHERYAFTRPLPEAQAVMDVVDRAPVDLYMGLHNERVAGASFSLSSDDGPLRGELAEALATTGLPVHRGEPKRPYVRAFAPGVYAAFALPDAYEHHARYGTDPAVALDHGTTGEHYAAAAWDCFTLTAEVPYFTSAKVADTGPAGMTRREAKLRGIELEDECRRWLWDRYLAVAELLTQTTPWQRSVHEYLVRSADDLRAERSQVEREPEFGDEATVAQMLTSIHLRELTTLAHVGRFATMLAAEPERDERLDQPGAEALAKVRARAPHLAAAAAVEPVPIRRLVQAQLAALLYGLDAVRERYRPARPRPASSRHSSP